MILTDSESNNQSLNPSLSQRQRQQNVPLLQSLTRKNSLIKIILFLTITITITYSFLGIIFLCNNYNLIIECPQSHILLYTVTYICLFIIGNIFCEKTYQKYTEIYFWIFSGIELCNITIVTWAVFELCIIPYNNNDTLIAGSFNNNTSCLKLQNSDSWTFMESTVVVIIIFTIVYAISIAYLSTHREEIASRLNSISFI